jgi:nicotinate-nucleotide adenylyltransferase
MDLAQPLGVFGGTFDPIHHGHLFIAEEAATLLGLERVVFVPTGSAHHLRISPPHASAADRAEMVRLAIASNPRFALSLIEAEAGRPAFTIETLRALRAEWPGAALHFIVGVDALMELPRWRDPVGILELAEIVAVERGGFDIADMDQIQQAIPSARGRVRIIHSLGLEISATDIRRRIAQGETVRYLLPDAVREYIEEYRLYADGAGPAAAPGLLERD